MARKSRKGNVAIEAPTEKVYNTAIYARLSVEDCRDKESDSLDNQVYLIEQYIQQRPYLKLVKTYTDNGETGTNFQRPGFQSLIDDIKSGKINCIVVKDLSRFGRNYIETGEYLENIFPFMGVRFVAINDFFDNHDKNSNSEALIISLKNLINDFYAKDISKKIIASLSTKQKRGEYIGGLPVYGYKKSEQDYHKLVIDEETAPIVRDVFRWKAEGMGDTTIAKRLNEIGIPSPAKRQLDRGDMKHNSFFKHYVWRDRTIRMMTTNPVYIGHMAQGKTKQALCENARLKAVPQSEWIIVENTHEPIIDLETWEKAQNARANNTNEFYKNYDKSKHIGSNDYLFKGLLVCADCGSRLIRYKASSRSNNPKYNFLCPLRRKGLSSCGTKNVHEDVLHEVAMLSIKKEIDATISLSYIVEQLNKANSATAKQGSISEEILSTRKELKRLTNLKATLFESYADKTLSENEYIYSKQKYDGQIDSLKRKLDELEKQSVLQSETLTPKNKRLQIFQSFINQEELSKEMVEALIQKIIVCDYNRLEFVWKYNDEYRALLSYTGEVSE